MWWFKKKEPAVCEAIGFIYEYARKSKRGIAYSRNYRNLARHLNLYSEARGIKVYSNNYTYEVAEDYVDHLRELGLMKNTIKTIIGKTAYMFRKMGRNGYEVNYSFEDVRPDKEKAQMVYLTTKEIHSLHKLPIRDRNIRIIRDVFVIGCLTGMRYGDYSCLSSSNLQNGRIVRKTQKTGEVVEIPTHWIIKETIGSYSGFPKYESSSQNFNKVIKGLCKKIGATEEILWERTVGKKVVRKRIKKYKMVSSHTARRSFATNAYLAGIPTARIMLLTGHKTEQAFFSYIRIQKAENASILSEHPFFKGETERKGASESES